MSYWDHELIYHKRYPRESLSEFAAPEMNREEKLRADRELDKLFEKLDGLEPDRKREIKGTRFVHLVRFFSEYFEMDTDIRRYRTRLTADFYSPCYYFGGDVLKCFLKLAGMCDDFSITTDDKGGIVIGLVFMLVEED